MAEEQRTAPPVRLRMTSADFLCQRSMTVSWVDGTGASRSWSSAAEAEGPEGGWFEAEKLLPARARHIRVAFQAHGPGGPWDVCQVERREECRWVLGPGGKHVPETFRLRADGRTDGQLDLLFELAGPLAGCYVWRAWNPSAARHEAWEFWAEKATRPRPFGRLLTLEAADGAAPLLTGDPLIACKCATKRLAAAARTLIDVHRKTLQGLRALDSRFTDQWLGANVGSTASAGLGIASAVLLFTAPPLGVGLGIGSSLAGGLTFAGDSLADHQHWTALKLQLSEDAFDAFAFSELLREWAEARKAVAQRGAGMLRRQDSLVSSGPGFDGRGASADETMDLGAAVDQGLVATAVADGVAVTGARLAEGFGRTVAGASQVLGVAGALITTGFMIRGWSSTKAGQAVVREKVRELTLRVLQLQHLLATTDRLECPVSSDDIILGDSVRRCSGSLHCFHARSVRHCLGDCCPVCGSLMEPGEELLADSVENCQKRLQCGLQPAKTASRLLSQACGRIGERERVEPRPRNGGILASAGCGFLI